MHILSLSQMGQKRNAPLALSHLPQDSEILLVTYIVAVEMQVLDLYNCEKSGLIGHACLSLCCHQNSVSLQQPRP